MADRPLKNIPASVHQRLLNLARETNRPFNEVLQYFAIERFLFRFSRSSYANQFVLKGAQMLQAWKAPLARPTMDIDMLGRPNSPESLESDPSSRLLVNGRRVRAIQLAYLLSTRTELCPPFSP